VPPDRAEAAAGVVFFNDAGYLGMCGHGLIGLVRTLEHLGRIAPGAVEIDTPVGPVGAVLASDGTVAIRNVTPRVACLDVALGSPLCGDEGINPRLQAIITRRLAKARTLLRRADAVPGARGAELVARARRQLDRIGARADAFVDRKRRPITQGCRDGIRAALDRIGGTITPACCSSRSGP